LRDRARSASGCGGTARDIKVLLTIAAICAGASVGALARWSLGVLLNPLFPSLPLGTLAANVGGGYLVGLAIAYFVAHPALAPEWRLLVITGFLGGLTTFSTFSAEVVTLAQRGDFGWALATVAAHLAGSLTCTVLGMLTYAWLRAA
jgi:CrcB protein